MSDEQHPGPSRRDMIVGAGAVAAGALLLNEAVAQNPAAQVVDRGATIRISALRTHRVGSKVYVKLETNQKIFGWGEVSALEPAAAEALTQSLFSLLDGENPTRIEH